MTADPVLKALGQVTAAVSRQGKGRRATPAFAAEGELPLDALRVEVDAVGTLAPTLNQEQARALHAVSTPAPHGQRERTVLDTRVRHTGEIAADAVALHWAPGAFAALQEQAAQALGLEGVEARLHKLLVYGPGQFFKPHQDTEKHPGMVATLVLVWPCAHIGGELQVWQSDSVQIFSSQHLQALVLRWFAFYADCRHEVKPVAEGWRVVLTFDLMLPTHEAASAPAAHPALVQALSAVFLPGGSPRPEPWLLLLDHEYTEHGLRWPLLKGDDRPRVAALRSAADALGLVAQLALAEIHQSWTASVPYTGRSRGPTGDPEPDELIEEDLSLNFWVDVQGHSHQGKALSVSLADCVSFTEAHDAFLVNEEYEGYMGNYGETLDYWYRRAALVLQSPVAAEASRFATQPEAALADALKLVRRADQHAALAQRLQQALPDLMRFAKSKGRGVLARYAKLAAVLPADLASALCTPFEWQHLVPADTAALADLATAHGGDWLIALLRSWAKALAPRLAWGWSPGSGGVLDDKAEDGAARLWPHPLPAFMAAGQRSLWPAESLDEVITQALTLLKLADASKVTPAQRLAAWPARRQLLCELAQALQCLPAPQRVALQLHALLQHVAAQPLVYPVRELVPLLLALPSPGEGASQELHSFRTKVRAALQSALQAPLPAADDHGLRDVSWTCRCADCQPAIRWAESPAPEPLVLPMAQARRGHVQMELQHAGVDMRFATLAQGSPHKLVISKPPGLHAQRQHLRAVWAADLAALDGAGSG